MKMLSNIEEATPDELSKYRSYVAPWNESPENTSQTSPSDYDVFTSIEPKHDIMSTIPEECSPIFNRIVEKCNTDDERSASEYSSSEHMVGSILDYIESDDHSIKGPGISVKKEKIQEACFLDNDTSTFPESDHEKFKNKEGILRNSFSVHKNTVTVVNRNENISYLTCSSNIQRKTIEVSPNSKTQNIIRSKSADSGDKSVASPLRTVKIQYCKNWSSYSFTVGSR